MSFIHFRITKQPFKNNRLRSLKSQLILLFLAIAIIPLVVVVSVAFLRSQSTLRAQASNQLVAVRNLKVKQVETYLHQIEQDVQMVAQLQIASTAAQQLELGVRGQGLAQIRALGYLGHPELFYLGTYNPYAVYHGQYHTFFSELAQNRGYADVWLVSPEGDIIYTSAKQDDFATNLLEGPYRDTVPAQLFQNLIARNEESQVQMTDYTSYAPAGDIPVSFAGAPLVSEDQTVGILVVEFSLEQISDFMQDYTGLGETGETYLVGIEDRLLRSRPRFAQTGNYYEQIVDTTAVQRAASEDTGVDTLENYRGIAVLSAYQPLKVSGLKWVLLAEVETLEAFGPANRLRNLMGFIILATTLIVAGIGLYIGRSIANPIVDLAQTATRIAAGDLKLTAKTMYKNEIGHLAQAFNSMTAQLRDLIGGLEQRVAERTHQLETAAQVAREATAIHDVNQLLDQTARLISERFDFYHAGIFLLDETQEYAVLHAASSEGGQRMLAREHKLKVGETGIVGYVTGSGEPRIALDVGEDAAFFDNPDLPDTRSEMALPLKVQERVIGALDVQSTEPEAFGEDDVAVLLVMADQLAIAIENARLLQATQQTVNELSTAVAEILAVTSQQVAGASEQSAALSQTTSTVDEVKVIAEQAVARAQEVADTSQRSVEISRNGRQVVQNTINGMGRIKERVTSIAENILTLSEQTQQIGDIIASVNDLAAQSNMLALNAAVEAARAGEHGKGFAVVAAEVRALAEQSKQATAQIKAILQDIQQATNSTVMATEEGTKGVDEGVLLVAQTHEVIEQLAGVIDASAQVATQMVAGGRQQASGIEQIALAMRNINQATAQSLASTHQAEQTAQGLNALARSLSGIVEQYQV